MPNLVKKKSNIRNAGNGLFANKIFRKGDNVAEYFGVPVTKDHIYKLYMNDPKHYMKEVHPFVRDIDDNRVIVGGMEKDLFKCGVLVNDFAHAQFPDWIIHGSIPAQRKRTSPPHRSSTRNPCFR